MLDWVFGSMWTVDGAIICPPLGLANPSDLVCHMFLKISLTMRSEEFEPTSFNAMTPSSPMRSQNFAKLYGDKVLMSMSSFSDRAVVT